LCVAVVALLAGIFPTVATSGLVAARGIAAIAVGNVPIVAVLCLIVETIAARGRDRAGLAASGAGGFSAVIALFSGTHDAITAVQLGQTLVTTVIRFSRSCPGIDTFEGQPGIALFIGISDPVAANLEFAPRRTTIARQVVAIVALFTISDINDGVSAALGAFDRAGVRATVSRYDVAIVALFVELQLAVAASRFLLAGLVAAISVIEVAIVATLEVVLTDAIATFSRAQTQVSAAQTVDAIVRDVRAVIALLAAVDECIATVRFLAQRRTAIAVDTIAVIALFVGVERAVAAVVRRERGLLALTRTAIAVGCVTVVAFLADVYDVIAADFQVATAVTTVPVLAVAIVAILVIRENAIAALALASVIAAVAVSRVAVLTTLTRFQLVVATYRLNRTVGVTAVPSFTVAVVALLGDQGRIAEQDGPVLFDHAVAAFGW
jgi:hypothetical protein